MKSTPGLELDSTTLLGTDLAVTKADVRAMAPRLSSLAAKLRATRAGQTASFVHLPYRRDTDMIAAQGARIAARYARTVVFGIGGSSLGGETLVHCLGKPKHPIRFFDNIDPFTLAELEAYDWTKTSLIVISKSGQTAETLVQFLSLLPRLEAQLGNHLSEHVSIITENPAGALWQLAADLGLQIIPHPPVGGRFAALSVVGLLPAAIAGVDIGEVLAGARSMVEACVNPDIDSNPAFFHAAAQYLHAQRGRSIFVFMPYVDRLRPLGLWYRQLLGESLGKVDDSGQSRGFTPVTALGATDQHSQLQLYLDGPDDKQYTFLVDPRLQYEGLRVPERFATLPAVQPLVGHTTGELLQAEYHATRETVTRHQRPNRSFMLDTHDPVAVGALMQLLEIEIVAMAELLQVDPFDQPAVEEGKRLAREYLAGT